MNRGGRPQNIVWQSFDKIEKDGKIYAKCIKCGILRSNRVDRMKSHISQCIGSKPIEADEIILDSQELTTKELSQPKAAQHESLIESEDTAETPKKKTKMSSFIVKTNSSASKKLDVLVAKFFYANNIPFSVVEHSTFQDLLQALRPGYHAPSRKALAGLLLDEVTAEVEQTAKNNLNGKSVSLIEDGWSNIHNDPVIATCIHSEGKSYFLEAVECAAVTKNADYHKQIIENAIQKAQNKYSCEVKTVVTDNAKVMEKARNFLLNDNNLNLITYGCSSHWLNLLGQDLTPDAIIKQVVKIQKYFRNHHLPSAWLKEHAESVKPQLPGDTRWSSQLTCLETFLQNRPFLQKIVEDHENDIDMGIALLINNYNLYKQCKDLSVQLKPISAGLDILQSDTATVADACHIWLSLLKESALQPHTESIQNRISQILKPFHFLAYILHPKYKGEGLTDAQNDSARTWAAKKINGCLPLLISYEAEETPFPSSYFSATGRTTNPVIWWKGISKCNGFSAEPASEFAGLAITLLSSPASSASIERVFSNFAFVHSKIRNRLGVEKCAKLVMCYRMLRGKNEPNY